MNLMKLKLQRMRLPDEPEGGSGETPSETAPEGSESTQTETPTPKAPEHRPDVQAALDAAKRITEQANKEREEYQKTIRALATRQPEPERQASMSAVPEVDEDEQDIDPKLLKVIEKRASKLMSKTLGEIGEAYTKDRLDDFAYRAQQEERQAESRLVKSDEDREIIRQTKARLADTPVTIRSRGDVWDETFFAIKGRIQYEKEQEEARKAPSMNTSTRTMPASDRPQITKEDRDVARRVAPTIEDDEIDLLTGNAPVSIESYKARLEKRSKKA